MKTAETGVHPQLEPMELPACEEGDDYGKAAVATRTDGEPELRADLHAITFDDGRAGGTQRVNAAAISRGTRAFWERRGRRQMGFRFGLQFRAAA